VVVDDVIISPLVEVLVTSLVDDVDPEIVTIDRPSVRLRDYQLVADQAAERRLALMVGALVVVAPVGALPSQADTRPATCLDAIRPSHTKQPRRLHGYSMVSAGGSARWANVCRQDWYQGSKNG
jgi:hypothetical protein